MSAQVAPPRRVKRTTSNVKYKNEKPLGGEEENKIGKTGFLENGDNKGDANQTDKNNRNKITDMEGKKISKIPKGNLMSKIRNGEKENKTRSNIQDETKKNMNKVQENKTQSKYKGPTKNKTNVQVGDKMQKSVEVQSNEKRLTNSPARQKLDFETLCCHHCDDNLAGHRYVLKEDNQYCIKCYEIIFANTCNECSKVISIDCKDLSYKGKHWHSSCFTCSNCKASVVDKQFGSKGDHIYCGACHEEQFGARCVGCGDVFRAGMKKMEYKGRQWHENCFKCCSCKSNIGDHSFIPSGNDIYCDACYEESFAAKCAGCSKAVTSGGVTYYNQPWHRECFTCTHCNQSLAGLSFTSRQDKPYCSDCAGELFSKKCNACSQLITGVGGTRFVSFEGRHWHSSCFSCTSCSTSLLGKGFISEDEDTLCPECAKKIVEADIVEP